MKHPQDTYLYKGARVTNTWIRTGDIEKYSPITQVYGIVFNNKGEILVCRESKEGGWIIPGGHPEEGESTEDLKKQKKSIEQQIFLMQRDTVVEVNNYPEDKEIDEFCKIAHKVVGDLGFEAKQSIVRKVVDTIVGTQLDIKVYGHLALNSSIIANVWKGGIQDVKFETECRNSGVAKCGEKYAF